MTTSRESKFQVPIVPVHSFLLTKTPPTPTTFMYVDSVEPIILAIVLTYDIIHVRKGGHCNFPVL